MVTGSSTRDSDNPNNIVGRTRLESGILWKVHVGLILVQLGYGSSYVVNKVALTNGVNPIVFAVYRDIVCLLVLVPIAFFSEREKRTQITYEILLLLLAIGFFGAFIAQMLSLYGVLFTSAAYASTISVLIPLYTFIISAACGFEQIRWTKRDGQAKVGGCICSVVGAVVLAFYFGPAILGHLNSGVQKIALSEPDTSGLLAATLVYLRIGTWQLGVLCLFVAGFSLGLNISIQAPLSTKYPAPICVAACGYLSGTIMLFITALLTVKDWSDLVMTERSTVISCIYNGLVPAAFGYATTIWCVQKAGPVLVGSYIPLQMFTAATLAHLFLGEIIYLGSVLGTILIVIGLGLITWGQVKGGAEDALPIKSAPPLDGMLIGTPAASLEEPLLQ